MAIDPRFFAAAGPLSLGELAAVAGASFTGDPARQFTGVASLRSAGPDEVSFLDNRRYLPELAETAAGAVVLQPEFAERVPAGSSAIITSAPYLGFARIAARLYPSPPPAPGRHATAVFGEGVELGDGCEIGPYAVIGARARLGPGCIVGPHAVVGAGVELGAGCRLHAHSSISHAIAGDRVVLHPGARVGQEGFGFAPTPDGGFETMPQLGCVRLGDGVEIGANACVDRGSQGDTVIGAGSRLDNLVQVAHNVRMGRGCVLVSLAGISGSVTMGDYVTVAAQAGVVGHVQIGSKARIGAQAGVINDVPAGSDVLGSPAWPVRETWRAIAQLRKLARGVRKTG